MSPDLRSLLHAAAPQPHEQVDARVIARRARRITMTRAGTAVATVLAVAIGGVGLASSLGERRPADVVGEGREKRTGIRPQPRPTVETHQGEGRKPPPGPRYEVVSGVHGDDWARKWRSKAWRLLVWAGRGSDCVQLAYDDTPLNHSLWCSHGREDPRKTGLGSSTSFFTGSEDGDEFWFVAGQVGPRVAELELRPDAGQPVSIPLHAAPAKVDVPYRYYAATLPRFDLAYVVALDEDGNELERKRVCGPGCQGEREASSAAEIQTYEAAPVDVAAKAAVFASSVVGGAGLLDEFGRRWSYRGISAEGSGFVVRFEAQRCTPPPYRPGQARCKPLGPARLFVGQDEDLFVVTGAAGPMSGAQRAAMLAGEEEVPADRRGWRLVAWAFARGRSDRAWNVTFALTWTGNIPAPPDYGSTCWMSVYARGGRLITRGPDLPFDAPDEEAFRVNELMTEIETDLEPGYVGVGCEPPVEQRQ